MFPTKVQQGLLHALWPNKILSHILPHPYRTYSLHANQLPTLFLLRAQIVAKIRTSRVATRRIISKHMTLVQFGCLYQFIDSFEQFFSCLKQNKTNNLLRDDITGGHVTTAANHGLLSWQVFLNLRPSNLIRLYHTICHPHVFSIKIPLLKYNYTKNCSLSIVLTATDQKPQKSLKRW